MPDLYHFHKANIHEHRKAAAFARAFPLASFVVIILGSTVSLFIFPTAFLVISAFLNVTMWVNVVYKVIYCISGVLEVKRQLAEHEREEICESMVTGASHGRERAGSNALDVERPFAGAEPLVSGVATASSQGGSSSSNNVGRSSASRNVHLIVIPNYKEDEEMMAQTMQSLSQAKDAHTFRIVLAMELREGEEGRKKAERLAIRFAQHFAQVVYTLHPRDLMQKHLDGSQDLEIPGKASNLRWAVFKGLEECQRTEEIDPADVLLTVADADCLFHPNYFRYISRDCDRLRQEPGSKHLWTMWQAPQLSYRNYYDSPLCSRIWGVLSSIYEFGGTCSLVGGGHHMVFSAYSLHWRLACAAQAWDGDVIAEDHHAFIKCWFYSLHTSATDLMAGRRVQRVCRAKLKVRPVHLPVKSLAVVSDSLFETYVARFHQAKRHAQGVAELAYSVLATYDTLMSLPMRMQSVTLWVGLSRVVVHLWLTHILPTLQAIVLGELTLVWLWNNRNLPMCPDRIWLSPRHETFLCGLAGAWALVWPVAIPMILIWVSNFMFLSLVFLKPASSQVSSLWHSEDGGIPRKHCWRHFTLACMLTADCSSCSALMVIYGFIPCLLAYINCMRNGNRFKYVTAAKGPSRELEMAKLSG